MTKMKVSRKINNIFKNLYSMSTIVLLCIAVILFISLSAQFIGNKLSKFIINNKSIKMIFVLNDNKDYNKDLKDIVYVINNNPNFNNLNIKTQIIQKEQIQKIKKNSIVISKDENVMKELASHNRLSILDRKIFDGSIMQYTKFSKFDEYALVETNTKNINIYIAYTGVKRHKKKVKILSILQALNKTLFKKDLEDPNEESWFDKKYNQKN